MKQLIFYSVLQFVIIACTSPSGRTPSDSQNKPDSSTAIKYGDPGGRWGNITVDTARNIIQNYISKLPNPKDPNITVSIWFDKMSVSESFNKIFEPYENKISPIIYDGFRIYFARYSDDILKPETSGRNTVVITKTMDTIIDGIQQHYDILKIDQVSGTFIQPLNDGGRCRPHCNGALLLPNNFQ